jgi:uncharacterized delta-60 repeat protein
VSTSSNTRYTTVAVLLVGAATAVAQQPFDLDPSFRTTIQSINVIDIALMNDGSILVSGRVRFTNNTLDPVMGSVRLFADGSRDAQFPTFPWTNGGGKIVHWNDVFYIDAAGLPRRLHANGLIDQSFQHLNNNAPLFSSFQGGDYHVYPDGSVVITGSHTVNVPDSGWVGSHHMIWFNNDGTLDLTRRPRKGNGAIYRIVPQPDGKFLLSGAANMWEGVPKPNIFRVHADGTLDTSFTCAMGWGEAYSMTVLEDGRILASGLFKSEFSSPDSLHFVRLMPDGSLDPTFNNNLEVVRMPWLPPEWPGAPIHWGQFTLALHKRLSDGRIVMFSEHAYVDGEPRYGLAMLDENGFLLDEPFGAGGCGSYYYAPYNLLYRSIEGLLEAPDGYIYIWGAYHGYDDGTTNDPTQRFVSRLYGLNVGVAERERITFKLYPNPASTQLTVQLEHLPAQGELVLRDALGREVRRERIAGHSPTLSVQQLPAGLYLLELWSKGQRVGGEKVVVE